MISNIITIGSRVEIRIVQESRREADNPEAHKYMSSKVADIDRDNSVIYMTAPIEGGIPRLLQQGIRYDFIFITEYGLYRAEGQCIGKKKDGEIVLNAIALTTNTAKFQRREYYRESCNIPVDFVEISEEVAKLDNILDIQEASKEDEVLPDFGTILDISGGGIRYSTPTKVKTNVYNLYLFEIGQEDKKKEVMVIGYVIASDQVQGRTDLYHNRVQFIFKNEKDREKIVQFVFEEQRRKRQNNK